MTEQKLEELYEEIENLFDNFDLCDASCIEGEDAADNALLLVRIKQEFMASTTREAELQAEVERLRDLLGDDLDRTINKIKQAHNKEG